MKKVGEFDEDELLNFELVNKGRKVKTTPEMAQMAKDHLTQSRTATLATAKSHLEEAGIVLGKTTIWRLVHGESLSFKRTALKGEVTLTQRVVELRVLYANRVVNIPDDQLLFLDETGFNLHLGVTRAWFEVGQTPVLVVPTNKGKNVSALVCISTDGIKNMMIKDGAYNSVDFVNYLTDLVNQFPEVMRGGATLVMDNARIHHAVTVIRFLEEKGIRYIFLPPYSPELNPIELLFGTVKAQYRRDGPAQSREEMIQRITDTFHSVGDRVELT